MSDVVREMTWRGMVHQLTDEDLPARLAESSQSVYVGFDATADSLHVGHLVGLVALRRLAGAGHRPIALLGGGTSLIGDPSFRADERPMLSVAEIEANAAGIRHQIEALIDVGVGCGVVVDNATWLSSLGMIEFLRDVGSHFTVNAMLTRDSVKDRLTGRAQGLSFTEFSYSLLQAYDFLHLHDRFGCRFQMGGSDQWSNITAGTDLIRRSRQSRAYGLTWPLLTRADGSKFGKTTGNGPAANVWLDRSRTSPFAFWQFWFRTADADVVRLLRLLTDLGVEEIDRLAAALVSDPRARAAQRALARAMTTLVHGAEQADRAQAAAACLYAGTLHELDEESLLAVLGDAPSTIIGRTSFEGGMDLVSTLVEATLVKSRSAARTAIEQGAISINGRVESDQHRMLGLADLILDRYVVLRRGKRDYHLLQVPDAGAV
ncbi:MAG: tyrosine--tRNA ligase [Acidimicrobiales bacterium]